MILNGTLFKVSDQSGAFTAACIRVLGKVKKRLGKIGDLVLVSIKRIDRKKKKKRYKKGMLRLGVIVRTKQKYKRALGVFLSYDENAIIMVNRKKCPVTRKLRGPIPFEVCLKYRYIATVAKGSVI